MQCDHRDILGPQVRKGDLLTDHTEPQLSHLQVR